MKRQSILIGAAVLLAALLGSGQPAAASAGPVWKLTAEGNTAVSPGETLEEFIQLNNRSDEPSSGTFSLKVELPPGLVAKEVVETDIFDCGAVGGLTSFTCVSTGVTYAHNSNRLLLDVEAEPSAAAGVVTSVFEVSGGGGAPFQTVDPVRISSAPITYGIDAFDGALTDASGAVLSRAAAHPSNQSTVFDLNMRTNDAVGQRDPVEDVKRTAVELPPGLIGNTGDLEQCSLADLSNGSSGEPFPLCPLGSQIGTAIVRHGGEGSVGFEFEPTPLFNLVPPPDAPARFGFNLQGTVVILDATVRSNGDYGVTVTSANTTQVLAVAGATVEFWGVPADDSHTPQRGCPGEFLPPKGPGCESTAPPQPFLRTPTTCSSEGLEYRIKADSWQHPGVFVDGSYRTHKAPGYPFSPEASAFPAGYSGPTGRGEEVGSEGCASVPFEPTISVQPTTNLADSPSGLKVDLSVPQEECWGPKATPQEAEEAACQSDLKDTSIVLPQGMSVNSASAGGLGACSPEQAGLTTPVGHASPIHFDKAPVSCPGSSKIGSVEIETPLLAEPLKGFVYTAQQSQNPFGSLLAIYMVAEGSGVIIKQAGEISADSETGQLTTRFAEAPQLPFTHLHLELYGGPRSTLRTPSACGSYTTEATLTPWARPGEGLVRKSAFAVTQGCGGGFAPKLQAGTENPLAGSYSPFNLRITREDGSQELGSLHVTLPPGVVSSLKGYTYCPDSVLAAISSVPGTGVAEEATHSCPASSFVGTATVGAGAGANPFYVTSGRAYLAGPYKGAPVSLAVVAPAVAGPFDLGSVVVRNAIHIDPTTAQLTIESDPLPTILHGIPLDLRDVRVRYNYTLNPTSCEPFEIGSLITSTAGATASPSVHFQVAGCEKLGFKPKLSLQLTGPTHRAAHPRLRAVLTARPGDANLGAAAVLLPKTELLENAHIRTICTRVQYNAGAGGGSGCPKGSIYGYARAWSPLLDKPLEGPVYLRANGGERELPDLVASLSGQVHVDLVGYIDAVHARIRNRFLTVPDAPVSRFELTMQGGKKGLLANNTELCRAKPRATAIFTGQNGKLQELRPLVKTQCGSGKHRRHHG